MLLPYTTLEYYGPGAAATSEVSVGAVSADIQGTAEPSGQANGVGSVTNAKATRLVNRPATITGLGVVTNASAKMRARPTSQIAIGSRPTAADVAQAVWGSIASQLNISGTMGEKLNGAGSAGNPWTEVLEGDETAAELMRLMRAVLLGKTTIVPGDGTAVVTFLGKDGTTHRVTATMEGSERSEVVANP